MRIRINSIHYLFFTGILILNIPFTFSQIYQGKAAQAKLSGTQMVRLNELNGNITYALFHANVIQDKSELVPYLKKVLTITNPYDLELIRTENDELGFEHLRYQLTYNQIPVLGGIIIAHLKDNKLHSFNGEIFKVQETPNNPIANEKECLIKALSVVNAQVYKWQIPEEEAQIKLIKANKNATWFPKGELMYCPADLDFDNSDFYLTYKFTIHANAPLVGENIYISPITQTLVARENLIHTADATGTAVTKYSGNKKITTDSTSPTNYRLRESGRGGGIYTLNLQKGTNYGAAVDFTDSNNIWNNVNSNKDEIATDAHWGAEVTYDYFLNTHGRKSYNNNNARIYSYVHYSSNYDNAFWNGVAMTYGDGSTYKPLTALDVCGHEIAHAVTSSSAALIYSNESGALNESFSDIFGNTIERYGRPTQYDWKIGEDITSGASGLRNMLNPKLKNHPRCYKSTNWYGGTADNGGVHTNSGVQNWWYYLITEGGKGTNDVANVYSVDSLGIQKAEKIAYRNLTVYLTPSSKYADARFYSIRAAVDLFGDCGKEVIAVTNAWYACNVGNKYDSGYVKADFMADTMVCDYTFAVKFNNLSSNSNQVRWYFGDSTQSSVYNPSHTYKKFGNYTVKLVAYSCFKGKSDSITKVSYVKVDSSFDLCHSVLMPQSGTDSTNKCQSFVYDDGGEGIYKQQNNTFFKISVPGSDSIVLKFMDFDYENKYDSLYLYRGKYPGGTLLGGFTGASLPFAGKKFKVSGSLITLRHRSDQLVTGRGFKLYYTAYKQPIDLSVFRDTTICLGKSVILHAKGKGGYINDYVFDWNTYGSNDSITVSPKVNTSYKVKLTDVCTRSSDTGEVLVKVRAPLVLKLSRDTTICIGQTVQITADASGGLSTAYKYLWDNGLGNNATYYVSPTVTTTYRVILTDACTVLNDTGYITITVRDPLKVNFSTMDSVICYNKSASINASGSGGLSSNYTFTWSHVLGKGVTKNLSLTKSTWITCTLTDACTSLPHKDSILIKVRQPLAVNLNADTTICMGTTVDLKPIPAGGNSSSYSYQWSHGLAANPNHKVGPITTTKYIVTLTDNCSDPAKDSILVNLLSGLKISGLKDTLICYDGNASFKPIVSGGKPLNYTYTWDNGLNANKNQLVSPKTNTSYTLILKDNCTVKADTVKVNVMVRAAIKLNAVISKPVICDGDSSLLSLTMLGGISSQYLWFIDGLPSNKSTIYLKPSLSSKYKIKLSDQCSNRDSAEVNLVVNPLPTIDFNADKIAICRDDEVQFTNLSAGLTNHKWNFGTGDQSLVVSPKYSYKKAGAFDVSLSATSTDGCNNTLTKPNFINVIELPNSDFSFTPDDPKLPNPTVTFTNLSSNYTSFIWHLDEKVSDNINTNPTYTFPDKGEYNVRLISKNSLGCADSIERLIIVEDVYYLWVPNAFSPNNDGINDELKIISKGIATSEVAIYNRWGEKLYHSDLNGKAFDGRDNEGKSLPRGSYLLEIKLRDYTQRYHIVRKMIEII